MASGCLGLISFPREPGRLTLEQIETLHPTLIEELRGHEGIGFLLVDSERDGALAIGAEGVNRLERGEVLGEDPLAPYGPNAARHVLRTHPFPHCPDIVVNSTDLARPDRGRRVRGARRLARRHGRLAVLPVRARPVRPRVAGGRAWSAPRRVHLIFRRWLAELGQDAYADEPAGATSSEAPGSSSSAETSGASSAS